MKSVSNIILGLYKDLRINELGIDAIVKRVQDISIKERGHKVDVWRVLRLMVLHGELVKVSKYRYRLK